MIKRNYKRRVFATGIALFTTASHAAVLEEVIVTAQKRAQSLQDVPFSVSALSGQALENSGVVDLMDLQSVSPSLMTPSTGAPGQGASFRLRGFGSPPFQLGIEPAVATFVDGVYRSRSGIAVNDLVDIDRIEVLKGPQGTLFGKNTTAGVIHVITNRPEMEALEGFVDAGYEKYDRKRASGVVNLPLGDTTALRVSGQWAEGDGWLKEPIDEDDSNNLNRSSLNAQLRFQPTDALDINLSAYFSNIDEYCCAALVLNEIDSLDTHNSKAPVNDATDRVYSAHVNWDIGEGVNLVSITSYQDYNLDGVSDGDFVELELLDIVSDVAIEGFTQELRVSGGTASLEWTAGGFYSDESIDRVRDFVWGQDVVLLPIPITPGLGLHDVLAQDSSGWSAFGQATWSFSDRLRLTGGLRYIEESKDGSGRFDQPQPGPLPVVNPAFDAEIDEDAVTGMVSLSYDWSENAMTYLTYQHGYKAGGINLAREASGIAGQPSSPTFDSEGADNYELGAKVQMFDNRLRLNGALFHTEYQDVQNQILEGQSFIVRNGEGATVDGLELDGAFVVTDNFSVNFGLTLLDTEFESGTNLGNGDIGGLELPWAPDTSGSVGWDYEVPINNLGLSFFFSGSAIYKSSYVANSSADPDRKQDSYGMLNARTGLRDGSWTGSLWCRNCTDERVVEVQFDNPLFGTPLAYVNRPLELGVSIRYDF